MASFSTAMKMTRENMHAVGRRLDPEIRVAQFARELGDLRRRRGEGAFVVHLQQRVAVTLGQGAVRARGVHQASRGVMLLQACDACAGSPAR